MDIAFLITTCNRRESCQRLVDSLQGLGDIYVLNDGGGYIIDGATQNIMQKFNGKRGYWKTVNWLFHMRGKHKYYIMLPDDFGVSPDKIQGSIRLWSEISDPKKICLSIYEGRPNNTCWTGFKAVMKGNVWQTQWVDMCFIAEEKFFTVLGVIPPLKPSKSSGVGAYISRYFHKRGYNMYQVKESLVEVQPEHSISQMQRYNDNSRDSNNTKPSKHPPQSAKFY